MNGIEPEILLILLQIFYGIYILCTYEWFVCASRTNEHCLKIVKLVPLLPGLIVAWNN